MAAIVALHASLIRIVLPVAGQAALDHGGREATVHLGVLSGTDPQSEIRAAHTRATVGDQDACVSIQSILPRPGEPNQTTSFSESAPCEAASFDWVLVDGRWPEGSGEVAVSRATGWQVGQKLPAGLLPERMGVVGVVENPWSTDSHSIIAGSGTWISFGWPEVQERFPRLGATLAVHTSVVNGERLAASYSDSPAEVNLQLPGERRPLSETQPVLYRLPTLLLGLAVMALVLALRTRTRSNRTTLLVSQGMSPRLATGAAHLADFWGLVGAALAGVALGVAVNWPLGLILRSLIGHDLSSLPPPIDPVLRGVLPGLGIALIYSLHRISLAGRRPRPGGSEPRSTTARHVAAIVLAGAAALVIAWPFDLAAVIIAVLVATTLLALLTPDIVRRMLRVVRPVRASSRLALRRVQRDPGPAAAMLAAAILAVGPGVALLTIATTQLALDNANERIPPSAGQVLYYPSGSLVDAQVAEVIDLIAPASQAVRVFPASGPEGQVYVGTEDGLGAVSAVSSVHDLELVLGTTLTAEAAGVLNAGGVLWTGQDHGPRLVSAVGDVPVPESMAVEVDERWSRASEGFVLLGGSGHVQPDSGSVTVVVVGLNDQQIGRIPAALAAQGIDREFVRTPRPDEVHVVDPLTMTVVAGLALLGTALLVSAARGRVATLRSQASDLAALGVPPRWTARSLIAECGPTLVIGALTGIVLSATVTALGLTRLGSTPVIPFSLVLTYLAAVGLVIVGVVIAAGRLITARLPGS
ncbi:MAG: hypothetical protein Q4G67_09060 [Actinomycetia bacterium]|nr:hypothetical protein [Actinomycetes bacterium]